MSAAKDASKNEPFLLLKKVKRAGLGGWVFATTDWLLDLPRRL